MPSHIKAGKHKRWIKAVRNSAVNYFSEENIIIYQLNMTKMSHYTNAVHGVCV